MGSPAADETARRLRFRYPAVCTICGRAIAPGEMGYWDKTEKRAACLGCMGESTHAVQIGTPGGSALEHAEDLQERAVRQAERKWGPTAAAVAAKVIAEDHDVRAWKKGGDGETRLGRFLDKEVGDIAIVLHDRVIPGTRHANIDHIVVAPSGIWVVDAKTYSGEVTRVDAGSIFSPDYRVYVGRRNQSKLADGLGRQIAAVRAALATAPDLPDVPVHPALCFVDTHWPLLLRPFEVRGVTVINPRALRDRIRKREVIAAEVIPRVAYVIAEGLPPAS